MGSIISNKNTAQDVATFTGDIVGGSEVSFFIAASRFYIKASDAVPTPVALKSGGKTPTGWTDMGMMYGAGKVTYTKDTVKLKSGTDKILRKAYIGEKNAELEIILGQYDEGVLKNVTGLSPYTVSAGSIVHFSVGAESLVQTAVLLVQQNKTDGKEVQYYNPSAFVNFSLEEQDGSQVVKVNADMPAFQWAGDATGTTSLFSMRVFHEDLPGNGT
jgi:hypothetical protein